jgi:glycosyltransferase involved in cell wall biosynthesis
MIAGIDARAAVEEAAGGGRYVRELLRAIAARGNDDRYLLYARTRWDEPLDERFEWRLIPTPDPLWHLRAARAANRECEVYLSTNSYLTPLALRVPSVVVVFDLVTYDPSLRPSRRSTVIERLTLGPAVRRAAHLTAISQATADALVEHFPKAAGRVTVTPLGVPAELAAAEPAASGEREAFVLAVGTLEPRKNLARLVEAYSRLPRQLQDEHQLVVAGPVGWEAGETLDSLRGLGERCRLLGYVPDSELARLYRRCALFCYPSLGEGFGLPVLEAMHAGAAVVSSDRPSLPEVGGDAVEYVDPADPGSIADGLERLLRDGELRARLGARAAHRAREFSWDRTAELTLEALEGAAR